MRLNHTCCRPSSFPLPSMTDSADSIHIEASFYHTSVGWSRWLFCVPFVGWLSSPVHDDHNACRIKFFRLVFEFHGGWVSYVQKDKPWTGQCRQIAFRAKHFGSGLSRSKCPERPAYTAKNRMVAQDVIQQIFLCLKEAFWQLRRPQCFCHFFPPHSNYSLVGAAHTWTKGSAHFWFFLASWVGIIRQTCSSVKFTSEYLIKNNHSSTTYVTAHSSMGIWGEGLYLAIREQARLAGDDDRLSGVGLRNMLVSWAVTWRAMGQTN